MNIIAHTKLKTALLIARYHLVYTEHNIATKTIFQ